MKQMQNTQNEGTNGKSVLPLSFREVRQASERNCSCWQIMEKKSQGRERLSITQIHISDHAFSARQHLKLFLGFSNVAHGPPRVPETLSGVCGVKPIFTQTLSSCFCHSSDTCTEGTKEMWMKSTTSEYTYWLYSSPQALERGTKANFT